MVAMFNFLFTIPHPNIKLALAAPVIHCCLAMANLTGGCGLRLLQSSLINCWNKKMSSAVCSYLTNVSTLPCTRLQIPSYISKDDIATNRNCLFTAMSFFIWFSIISHFLCSPVNGIVSRDLFAWRWFNRKESSFLQNRFKLISIFSFHTVIWRKKRARAVRSLQFT